jgi:hypothetical protein
VSLLEDWSIVVPNAVIDTCYKESTDTDTDCRVGQYTSLKYKTQLQNSSKIQNTLQNTTFTRCKSCILESILYFLVKVVCICNLYITRTNDEFCILNYMNNLRILI